MASAWKIMIRGLVLGLLTIGAGLGAFLGYVHWYSQTELILPGVMVGQVPVGGLRPDDVRSRLVGARWRPPLVADAARGNLAGGAGWSLAPNRTQSSELLLVYQGRQWPLNLREFGAVPDHAQAAAAAYKFGRQGSLWDRANTYLEGVVYGHVIPYGPEFRDDVIQVELERIAADIRTSLRQSGAALELDIPASIQAVHEGVLTGRTRVDLIIREAEPDSEAMGHAEELHALARFTTPILAAEAGRVHNIGLAIQKIDGLVLLPGQVFSFNEVVGPRDAAHGWAPAAELYQGEFVQGYGGGICQVSSTLYNAALLSGMIVTERHHHSRPLRYVDPGRDATVAWELLDFKFQNGLAVPVSLRARMLAFQPQQIEVALYSPRPTTPGSIWLEEGALSFFPPDRLEVLDPRLPPDRREVVDEGHYGLSVATYRVFHEGDQERRELVSHDTYLPRSGWVRVGSFSAEAPAS